MPPLVTITIATASDHHYLQFIMPAFIFGFFKIAYTGEKSNFFDTDLSGKESADCYELCSEITY